MAKKREASQGSKTTAPEAIRQLVEKFAEHHETYSRSDYKEASLRNDFLNPFFAALGWDVDNEQGKHETYRDVILEHSMQVERSVRAPDYCFRIGGTPKFFVEAKKLSVDIESDAGPAFQVRRYAWTAKLSLSILTDFEEFAVYDCRVKPDVDDKAATARVMLLKYTDYVDRWSEIASVFSPTAIEKGSFDQYAESNKKKRGTAPVDEAFLEEIESWRELLAKNLCLRNANLDDRQLNTAVQLIIDRIIFLRMCEGRRIEEEGRLQMLTNGDAVYVNPRERLQEQLRVAENVLAFLGSVSLALLTDEDRQILAKELRAAWQKGISPGHWRDIIVRCSKLLGEYENSPLASSLCKLNAEIDNKGLGKELKFLIQTKNDYKHDRGPKTESDFIACSNSVQASLDQCMKLLAFWTSHPLRQVREMDAERQPGHIRLQCLRVVGDHPGFRQENIRWNQPLKKGDLYIEAADGFWVPLYPYMQRMTCHHCKSEKSYFVDFWDGNRKSSMKSFERGHSEESAETAEALSDYLPKPGQ